MYPAELVKPMKEQLTQVGFQELFNASDVNNALSKSGTTLLVVNSVCGCAAANARPAVKLSLSNNFVSLLYYEFWPKYKNLFRKVYRLEWQSFTF